MCTVSSFPGTIYTFAPIHKYYYSYSSSLYNKNLLLISISTITEYLGTQYSNTILTTITKQIGELYLMD